MPDSSFAPVPFGEWMPDKATHMSPDLAVADNVLPISASGDYAPYPAHVQVAGTALPSAAKGFFPTLLSDGRPIVYGATKNAVYIIRNGAVSSVYTPGSISAQRWWFGQVGGKVCAGTDGIAPVGGELGASMAPLGGSPPQAAVGTVVDRDFLVLGNLKNEPVDGTVTNRVRWSGVMNPDTWGTNIATGADFEDMHEQGGPIVQITSSGLVFSRKAITRMQRTGNPSTVFSFTTLELGRGAVSAGAVCEAGPLAAFRADDGFFIHDGTQPTPIGTGKVDQWFADNADNSKIDLMRSGYDPVHRCLNWAFTELGQSANSAILSFSLAHGRWTLIRLAMQEIAASATLPATIESMPTPDTDPISWDDGSRAGKKPVLAGIDSANTYGTFTGTPLASTIVTGDYQASPGRRSFVSGVRPLVDAAGVQVALGVKSQATKDALVWNPASSLDVDGVCHQRADARYARFKQTTVAGETWTRSKGLEVDLSEAGER
jgi:hypothetical protein